MPAAHTKKLSHFLTQAEEARLHLLASKFGIQFDQVDDKTYLLKALDCNGGSEVWLPVEMAHRRLLAEICTRAAKWVPFRVGMSCRDSLLRDQSESQLARVAELYARDRDARRPLTADGCSMP